MYPPKKVKNIVLEMALLALTALLLYKVDFSLDREQEFYFKKRDIYFEYQSAKQLQNGENPYERILGSNMLENDKYATQLPLYFYVLVFIRQMSGNDFGDFLENWRMILYISQLVGGGVIYLAFRKSRSYFLGFCCALFYIFNVWSLNSILYLKQDMPAISLLLLSFYFLASEKYRWLSYLFFGISLGIKHIGIFASPVFLMPFLNKQDSPKQFFQNVTILLASVLLPSLPLFIANPQSFVNSMLFSLTRTPLNSEITYGYNELLVKYDPSYNTGTLFQQLLPRLPLLIASLLSAALLFSHKITSSTYFF